MIKMDPVDPPTDRSMPTLALLQMYFSYWHLSSAMPEVSLFANKFLFDLKNLRYKCYILVTTVSIFFLFSFFTTRACALTCSIVSMRGRSLVSGVKVSRLLDRTAEKPNKIHGRADDIGV